MPKSFYDDNYGHWDMGDDPDGTQEFYREVTKRSRRKKCQGCGRMVKILPEYAYCNACADNIENGWYLS